MPEQPHSRPGSASRRDNLSRARSRVPLLLLFALLVAVGGVFLGILHAGLAPSWPHALGASIGHVAQMALVLGIAWWVATRFVPGQHGTPSWSTLLALHASAATVAAALAIGAGWVSVRLEHPFEPAGYPGENAPWIFTWFLLLYSVSAATAYAVQTRARLQERDAAAVHAELQALRAQLNPHFLFNTLHSLTTLVRDDPAAAEDALERFGDLMRYVLDASRGPGTDVPLEQELAFARDYLALERLRFGERLRTEEDVTGEARACAVPPLLLQPLVENAVRHGIGPLRRGGTVRLAARREGGSLVVEVADDGAGAPAGEWEHTAGLGLEAVRRQLAVRFPGEHQMSIVAQPGAGFEVQLRIPARSAGLLRRPGIVRLAAAEEVGG